MTTVEMTVFSGSFSFSHAVEAAELLQTIIVIMAVDVAVKIKGMSSDIPFIMNNDDHFRI